jgi:hypothetical protein
VDAEPLEFDFTAYLSRRLDADVEAVEAVLGAYILANHAATRRLGPVQRVQVAWRRQASFTRVLAGASEGASEQGSGP